MASYSFKHRHQILFWVSMAGVISAVMLVVFYTNTTLRSIEKNLPNTLLVELNSLSVVLEEVSDVVSATQIAKAMPSPENLALLETRIEKVHNSIIELRDTFVADNLINASAFHAVLAPAIADLLIWSRDGISGYGPDSEVTLSFMEVRIAEAFHQAIALKHNSQQQAQQILDNQRQRLGSFQQSATIMLMLTLLIVFFSVYLLIRQITLKNREIKTNEQLQEQHNLLESLLQNLPLGIAVWDKNRNILHLNKSFTRITGYTVEDMPNLSCWAQLAYPDPEYRQYVVEHWRYSRQQNSIAEYRVTCKNGEIKDIEFQAAYLPDSRIINTFTDVTERNRNEHALQESRKIKARATKMESLGLLAGGVAHDLNNILSGVVSYPELLLIDLKPDNPMRKPIQIIQDSGQKAAAIVQDLLTVARGVAIAKESVNINEVVKGYLQSPDFRRLCEFHPGVSLDISLDEDLANIMGSQIHILKILMNLVSNGFEAIEDKGRVLITTGNCFVDSPFRGYNTVDIGEYVLLAVSDEGKGISEEDLERIFEPFYTKKVMGRSGTGLGLAVVWNVVQDHNGYINVVNSEAGTTFQVFFPITGKERREQDAPLVLTDVSGHGEEILVVDDIETQRHITSLILEKLGYTVRSAASGEEAIESIKKHHVDLVLLDMIMAPGMSGRETYEQMLRVNPHQKAIIISGFAETEDVKVTLSLGASDFLKKPLKIHDLGTAIREAIGAGHPGQL